MSTTRVSFLFTFEGEEKSFERWFDLPSALVVITDDDAHPSDEYRRLWSSTIKTIMDESQAECLKNAPPTCACGSPTTTTSQIPMPFLSAPGRFVLVSVEPLCGREKCRTQVRQKMLSATSDLHDSDSGLPSFTEVMSCKVCATVDDVKRCSRCLTVAYCGKAHQRQDWAVHKEGCIPAPGVKEGHAAPTPSSGPQGLPPADTQETRSGEGSDGEGSATFKWTSSRVSSTGEGIQYEVNREGVVASLLSGGNDYGEDLD